MKKVIIVGYSGHAFVVIENLLANSLHPFAYCEKEIKNYNPFDLEYYGNESTEDVLRRLESHEIYLGIGENKLRSAIYARLSENGISTPCLSHPRAIVSPTAFINVASIIMAGAMINSFVKIGKAALCNTSCVIEHECVIGDFAHIGPGAVLTGNVHVGDYSFIGAAAVIKPGVKIGKNVIVGAGAVILNDLPDGVRVFGNPGKIN
ncbi:MAG: acetyltransferase [Sediminibacterium sp.]